MKAYDYLRSTMSSAKGTLKANSFEMFVSLEEKWSFPKMNAKLRSSRHERMLLWKRPSEVKRARCQSGWPTGWLIV
ncbi:hypothetical protein T05_2503 [Trichinella murrelli]|uniref:Uncharacterized protein n=1 Tax=Trichinella murrelli TaxID=144512 RepID=A0A0V0TFY5_9BILA|nr:hypothetical protein T05_2503 [Trichinella murrelli]